MPTPAAHITLKDDRRYRGVFLDAQALRDWGTPTDGDVAQVYGLKRYYVFDGASTVADNGGVAPGTGVIQPTALPTGRWICNVVNISGFDYTELTLSGVLSNNPPSVGDGSSIVLYEWVLVDEPSGGVAPSVVLASAGEDAVLKLPIDDDWRSGGALVFLRITNDIGQISTNNPFSPLTSQLSLFHIISATPNAGFLTPAAGSRNWHLQYKSTFDALDIALAETVPDNITQTRGNKRISPLAGTSGAQSVVSGVTMEFTPDVDSYVRVTVNGMAIALGDGDNTGPCYFADPGDFTIAKDIKDIVQNDIFVWNGPTAFPGPGDPPIGYELDTDDIVEIEYLVSFPEPI